MGTVANKEVITLWNLKALKSLVYGCNFDSWTYYSLKLTTLGEENIMWINWFDPICAKYATI